MEISARNVMKYLTEIEEAAEDIIIDKEQIVELDRKRNKIREAKRSDKYHGDSRDPLEVDILPLASPHKKNLNIEYGKILRKLKSNGIYICLIRNKQFCISKTLHHDIQTGSDGTKTWMCVGNMFLKVPKTKAVALLENDYKELDAEINKLRKDLKPKVGKLRDLEGKSKLTAFDLNPLSKEELKTIEKS